MKISSSINKSACLLLFTYFFFINTIYAQKRDSVKEKPSTDVTAKVSNPNSSTSSNELDLYKLLYANAKDANKDLIQILQWTIGIVIVFIALVLGSQYLFNIRLNEEKIKKIKAELDTEYEKLKADLINDKNEAINSIVEDNKKLYEKNLEKTFERYEKQEERLGRKIKRIEVDLKIKSDELDGGNLFAKGEYSQALRCYVNANTLRLDEDVHYIPQDYTVEKIINCLSKIDYLWDSQSKQIEKFLGTVKESRSSSFLQKEIAELENIYKKKSIKRLSDFADPIPHFDLPYRYGRTLKPFENKGDTTKGL